MAKGISPLVATVLLIAITMAIAAILANWATTYTENALPSTSCVGGTVRFVSSDYPKWENSRIVAVIEARYVTLNKFKFAVLMNDDTVNTYNDVNNLELEPGTIGTIKTDTLSISESNVKAVQILTSCSDVKTDLTALK
ncbi:MAG: hypothetical protein PHU12_02285 [Candidatus Aenigmarchaeota archaeon]|nr:hypothetical protein [Candidatus Aenigmarchaeota archaeon]